MRPLSFKRRRFPADVIRHAVWPYFRFTLSFRYVEEMLAPARRRGQLRCWTIKFGPQIARNLERKRPAPAAVFLSAANDARGEATTAA